MVPCASIIADGRASIHKETAMPAAGKNAPAFTLPNQDGAKVKLSDFQGKKLLLFAYPKAATSG
jgi:peroxiredoxin Q/BCP